MDMIVVGQILRPHGVRGEVKVEPLTHDPRRFEDLPFVYIEGEAAGTQEELTVTGCKFHGDAVLLKFQTINSKDEAERLRGQYLKIPVAARLKLPLDHYYIYELEGLEVVTTNKRSLGILKEVISLPANDVYRIVDSEGKEYLIPAIKDVVKDVDLKTKIMTIDPLPGLLED